MTTTDEEWRTRQTDEFRDKAKRAVRMITPPRYQDARVASDELGIACGNCAAGHSDGILLTGPTGVGKSYAAYAALMSVAGLCDWTREPRIEAVSAPELMARCRPGAEPIRTHQREFGDTQSHDPVEWYSKASLLLIDDLGAEKPSEWTGEILYRIIDYRYNYQRTTIAVSNLTPPELAKHLGARLSSRLTEMCQTVVLKGEDRRRK